MANNTETARAQVILDGTKANATLKELENASKALNAELRKLAKGQYPNFRNPDSDERPER